MVDKKNKESKENKETNDKKEENNPEENKENKEDMKAKLKTGEIIEIIKNDDFSAAKYLNKETTQYIFDDEIEEIINDDNIKTVLQTKYYKNLYNSKLGKFELIEIPLNKDNWWYVQLDASIRFAFMKYIGLIPEIVVIEQSTHYTNIKIIRPNFNNLEEVNIWLQKRLYIVDELNNQAKCNSIDEGDNLMIYKFETL